MALQIRIVPTKRVWFTKRIRVRGGRITNAAYTLLDGVIAAAQARR